MSHSSDPLKYDPGRECYHLLSSEQGMSPEQDKSCDHTAVVALHTVMCSFLYTSSVRPGEILPYV